MSILNETDKKALQEVFATMDKKVTLALFVKEEDCETCDMAVDLLEEIQAMAPKIQLKKYNLSDEESEKYNIEMAPSIVFLDETDKYTGMKINGLPAGHEINSFINGILSVSGVGSKVSAETKERLATLKKPVNIKVFVTLGCPHCPGAVEKAHELALASPYIEAEAIEAQTFQKLSRKYKVMGVPKIVINEQYDFVGNQPLEVFLETIEKSQV